MFPIAIIIVFAMGMLAIGGLDLAASNAKAQASIVAPRILAGYVPLAEADYAARIGAIVQSGQTIAIGGTGSSISPAAPASLCNAGPSATCPFTGTYTAQLLGEASTTAVGSTEISGNVNINAREQRFQSLVIITLFNAQNAPIAQEQRTVTLRTYPGVAPYASAVDETKSADVYAPNAIGATTVANGAPIAGQAESDNAGCTDAAACGQSTTVASDAACNYVPNQPNSNPGAVSGLENGWCGQQAGQEPPSGATAAPQTLTPVNTSDYKNESWTYQHGGS